MLNQSVDHKPLASLSLDLDNQWSYMKTHGDSGWEDLPSYLDILIPHTMDILDKFRLAITFFIVGLDAQQPYNRDALAEITRRGHEVGNHSLNHEVWLHRHPKDRIREEILSAGDLIADTTGKRPVGFRGPGFTWSANLLEVLARLGYAYDASTLPTFLGPLARLYFFWTSDLTKAERKQRGSIYGNLKDGLRPNQPYCWQLDSDRRLLEIPVTTIPFIRSPFHLSYLIYLSRISDLVMTAYLRLAIALCRVTATQPSFLLHPLDLLGGDKVQALSFFPGMDLSTRRKTAIFEKVIRILSNSFQLVTMQQHAEQAAQQDGLALQRVP